MGEKIPSLIRGIALHDATFKNTKQFVEEPASVNFFFGNNGSGKSTIAKTIKSGRGITCAPGRTAGDYPVYLYDANFIDKHFHSYQGMAGIYTLNAENVAVQRQLEEYQSKLSAARKARDTAAEGKTRSESARISLQKAFQQKCWDSAKKFRVEFDKTQDGKRRIRQFTEAVLAAKVLPSEPTETDLKNIRQLYASAYDPEARQYPLFATIKDTAVLDKINGLDFLPLAIVNIADTPYAEFIKRIDAVHWVREGHTRYTPAAGGRCPYCRQTLPEDFEKTFSDSFDEKYEDSLKKLRELLTEYKRAANALFIPLQNPPADLYPRIDSNSYMKKVEAVRTKISLNIGLINKKISDPGTPVDYEPVAPLLEDLKDTITAYNDIIQSNNDIVAAGPRKKQECTSQVFSLIRYELNSTIQAYKMRDAEIARDISEKTASAAKYTDAVTAIQTELRRLSASTVETGSAKNHINHMLRDSGMQGFHLVPHETVLNTYKVVREDGSVAENLSEGEKNILAFLYFYYLVQGSPSPAADPREKIIVIDDPVSSMDSNSLFVVSSLVRSMIGNCLANSDSRIPAAESNDIKQIFVLTHNAFFYREVTYDYVKNYEHVSFYLIRKRDNCSYVKLFREADPNCPAQMRNVNPVKSSYAALWEEYYECRRPIPLINVARKILEYYFLQLCGYNGAELRKAVLVSGRAAFVDRSGYEDRDQLDLAQSMLAFISPGRIGFNDGLHYVEESADPDVCRTVVRKIFEIMHQEQHYKMMSKV